MKHSLALSLLCCMLMNATVLAQNVVDTRVHIYDNNVRSLKVCLTSNMYKEIFLLKHQQKGMLNL